MLIEKRFFFEGQDGDTNTRMLSDKACLNIMNARVGVTTHGRNLRLENIPGTTLVSNSVIPPYGTHQCIGSAPDNVRNRIIYVLHNTSDDHGIYCYDVITGVTYAVLYDSQVIGGLNFSKDKRIDRDCKVVGDLFYWTDDSNQPRKANIEAGIKMNHADYDTEVTPYSWPMNPEVITLIRKPPMLPLAVDKVEQVSSSIYNNFVKTFQGQFALRYYYRDGETSVISAYSPLVRYNSKDELYNRVDITINPLEIIDQDVQRVDLIKRYGNTNNFEVVFSWDKANAYQAAQIAAHNAGTQILTYNFYNEIRGEALGESYALKPFDSVPRRSKTLEAAKNRLMLGNNLIGYDTPVVSSLTASFQTQTEGATVTGVWYRLVWGPGFGSPNTQFVLFLDGIGSDSGYYGYLPFPGPAGTVSTPPFLPGTADFPTELELITSTGNINDILTYFGVSPAYYVDFSPTVSTADITNPPSSTSLVGLSSFKNDAPYQIGIVFYDFADRKCGVYTSDDLIFTTPDREFDTITYTTSLNWSLTNLEVAEIPEWATHYAIVITKCLSTRFFLEARVKNLTYVTKDADGAYVFDNQIFSETRNGIGIDITLLNSYGMGYVFAEGDLIKLYIDGASDSYTLSLIGQEGNWLIAELDDIGTIGDLSTPFTDALFQIYTPYQPFATEPYYEIGQKYLIENPGTGSRAYSVTNGSINGDIVLLNRSDGTVDYLTQNMSSNDKFYTIWDTDAGRVNVVSPIGEQEEPNTIAYSNVYIVGSRVNGLSSFDALDEKNVPNECGPITKLQLTSKVSEQGSVMLAICQIETASLYLGEVQLVGASSNAFIASAPEVIGTINPLKGSLGSSNKETVTEYQGNVRWLDVISGAAVEYSAQGLVEISRYRMSRFFHRYCMAYAEASAEDLDTINGFHHIPTGIDPFHNEAIYTLPALIPENEAEVLPSYDAVPPFASSIINRFDIYDRLGKTMAYCFMENKWGSNYEFMGEWYEYIQNTLFGWKNGLLYIHNDDTGNWNTFYGTQYPVRLCATGNINPSAIKVLNNIELESSAAPDYTVAMTEVPNSQITDLSSDDYVDEGGVFSAAFYKDRMSPNLSTSYDERLYTGDDLTDYSIMVMCEWQAYERLFFINFMNISYSYSRGVKQITSPING